MEGAQRGLNEQDLRYWGEPRDMSAILFQPFSSRWSCRRTSSSSGRSRSKVSQMRVAGARGWWVTWVLYTDCRNPRREQDAMGIVLSALHRRRRGCRRRRCAGRPPCCGWSGRSCSRGWAGREPLRIRDERRALVRCGKFSRGSRLDELASPCARFGLLREQQ